MMESAISCGHGMAYGGGNIDRWRFPPWIAFSRHGGNRAGNLQQQRHRDLMLPRFRRRVPIRSSHTVNSDFKICDCPVVCYFSMAIALILIGCLTTAFVLDDAFGQYNSMISQLWLVGPLFISCGIVIFVRTVIFLRRKQAAKRQREVRS